MRQNKDFISPEESVTKKMGLQFFAGRDTKHVPRPEPPGPQDPHYGRYSITVLGTLFTGYFGDNIQFPIMYPSNQMINASYSEVSVYNSQTSFTFASGMYSIDADYDGDILDRVEAIEYWTSTDSTKRTVNYEQIEWFKTLEESFNFVLNSSDETLFINIITSSSGYSITYHSDDGTPTPDDLTGQTALPDPLPTISKSNYIFNGWYLDSAFETPAVAGATISANVDLYAKFTEDTRIHCDLTQLAGWADLAAGQHTITVKAKASGYRDSEPSTGVTVTKGTWESPSQEGDALTITQAYSVTQVGDTLYIE